MAPFAWQSKKASLFDFTENSVSEIQFSPIVQRRWAFSIRSDIVGWHGSSIFNLGGNFILFVLGTTLSNIPTNRTWGFPFLHILTNTVICCLLGEIILTGVRWYLILAWFGFPTWLVILRIFVSVGHLYVFSRKLSIQWLCPLLKSSYLGFFSPQGWVVWVLYIVWILTSSWIYYLQIFSLLH